MLYERWRKISAERRNEIALRDFASGKRWTFGELFIAGEKQKNDAKGAADAGIAGGAAAGPVPVASEKPSILPYRGPPVVPPLSTSVEERLSRSFPAA